MRLWLTITTIRRNSTPRSIARPAITSRGVLGRLTLQVGRDCERSENSRDAEVLQGRSCATGGNLRPSPPWHRRCDAAGGRRRRLDDPALLDHVGSLDRILFSQDEDLLREAAR